MSIRNAINDLGGRLSNANFRNPKDKAEVSAQLRDRISNALDPQTRRDKTEEPSGGEALSIQTLRNLHNRVLNSDLSREDKSHLVDRIKNYASEHYGVDPANDEGGNTTSAASEVVTSSENVSSEGRNLLGKA